jgi:ribosomal protein S6--L-glutamate ligase
VKAARTLGLNVCGVDMLRSKSGPLVMEVNSSPGIEGLEKASGVDVAGLMIEFLERHAVRGNTRTKGKG